MIELLYLAYTFLKIGFLGFGGGYAMLSMIFAESEKRGNHAEVVAEVHVAAGRGDAGEDGFRGGGCNHKRYYIIRD